MCNKSKTMSLVRAVVIFLVLNLVPQWGYSAETTDDIEVSYLTEAFNGFVSWVRKELTYIDKIYFNPDSDVVENPAAVSVIVIEAGPTAPLDLTIPDIEYEDTIVLDEGQPLTLPDMFSDQAKKPYVKEKPSASFSGGLLMDDEELESMEEYRLRDVKDAVRGAEVSLEFKTN